MRQVKIYKSELETFGGSSLIGKIAVEENIYPPCEVEILFEQTSMDWKRKNGGPEEIIVTEHLLWCFVDDVLRLQEMGYKITVGEFCK